MRIPAERKCGKILNITFHILKRGFMTQKTVFAVLAAAIVILAAFAAFGGFSEQEKNAGSLKFSIDQLLIKVLVKEGESYSSSIRIVNGENPDEFSTDVYGAAGMASVSENKFFLNDGT